MHPTRRSDRAQQLAALLSRHPDPRRLARALEAGESADPLALESAAEALRQRQLVAWCPPDPAVGPLLLVRGALPGAPGVAVVGARAADPYGLACARRAARDAVSLGSAVISGGAEGCDAAAHDAALSAGGRTVVVLGSGHDHPYPAEHRGLFERVVEGGGAIVSAFWPTLRPARHRFLERNRVIAALAAVTVVARAGARSGALSTARAAFALGRPVLVVPGDVSLGLSAGGHGLVAQGAGLMTGLCDLARALGLDARGRWPATHARAPDPWPEAPAQCPSAVAEDDDPAVAAVAAALASVTSLDLDGLVVQTGLATDALVAALVELEVGGRVEQVPGQRYRSLLTLPASGASILP
ncbi:MAG: DNA-processing protein DprA [Deltaproteobacteria bacterium]|nr:DNA-processing protein DprA [Deltaproteobacteria bacterium]MCB9785520.1 DNA-processing protein DprA [Deltaproteobacteria bacterium]